MSKRLKRHLRFWVRLFWTTVFFAVILLAVLVQIGRTVFPIIDEYRSDIEAQLSLQLGVELSIGEIAAVWQGLRPRVSLNEVSILNDLGEPVFEVGQIDIELSILKTLINQSPSFRHLSFRQLEATFVQTQSQTWRVKGLPESTSLAKSQTDGFTIDDPLDIFLFGRRVQLSDTSLDFIFLNDLKATVVIPDIRLENDTSFHRISASFAVDGEQQEMSLMVEGLGDPRDEVDFEASGYLKLSNFPVEKVFAAVGVNRDVFFGNDVNIDPHHWQDNSRVDLNLWFSRKRNTGLAWQGNLSVDGVPFTPRDGMTWPHTLTSDFSGDWRKDDGWRLNLAGLHLAWDDFDSPVVNANIVGPDYFQGSASRSQPLQIALQSIDIQQWHEVASKGGFVSEHLKEVLDSLQPSGTLKNIKIDVLDKKRGYFSLKSEVSEVSIQAWQGVPEIENINGYIDASAFEGHLTLKSTQGFSLNFPRVYLHPLTFNQAEGDVRWRVDMENQWVGVSSGLVELTGDDVSAKGNFNLSLPFQSSPGIEPEMTLSIGVKKGVASLHKLIIPYTVPKKLNEWLDRSIKEGVLTDAGFIYHGSLMKENELSKVIQFSSRVQQAELKFDQHWPALSDASGVLLLDDEDFRVTDLRGRMMDTAITHGEVSLIRLDLSENAKGSSTKQKQDSGRGEKHQAIALKATVSGDSGRALKLLKKTPIAHILGDELGSWKMQGQVNGTIDLIVPLDGNDAAAKQNIKLQLSDNRLSIPSLKLEFESVGGPLYYSQDGGIASEGLTGNLWGQAVKADIKTQQAEGAPAVTVDIAGRLDISRLRSWSGRPELDFTEGVTDVEAHLNVPLKRNQQPIQFTANCSLEGVSISLPPPFQKESTGTFPVKANIEVYPGSSRYWFNLADQAEVLVVNEKDRTKGVTVAIHKKADGITDGEVNIVGLSKAADVGQWSETVAQYQQYLSLHKQKDIKQSTAGQPQVDDEQAIPIKLNVDVEKLSLGGISFTDVNVLGIQLNASHRFELSSKDIGGLCTVFYDGRPMIVDLDYLHLLGSEQPQMVTPVPNTEEPVKTADVPTQVGLASVDVNTLPAMDFHVKQFRNRGRDFGQWSFKLRPVDGGVTAYDLLANVRGLSIQGKHNDGAELIWLQTNGKNETFFSGWVSAKDVGSVMEKWDIGKVLTSDQASFNTDVQWYGAPDQMALDRLFGIIDVDLKHGRFIRGASVGENPLVKLIGLLNFDTLARRLRFDFSDLHPEGMSYDGIKGTFQFYRGMVKTQQPLLVEMPASNIQFLGDIDVINEKVDASLVVTLPLAGISTTAVAALTGGVPLAVGVYVVGKIFKRQVDQASSIRYRVEGSWEDPDVNLKKVFENKVEE